MPLARGRLQPLNKNEHSRKMISMKMIVGTKIVWAMKMVILMIRSPIPSSKIEAWSQEVGEVQDLAEFRK